LRDHSDGVAPVRSRTIALFTIPIGPPAPFRLERVVPQSPGLMGTTFSFQALTVSNEAPLGRALSNPTSLLVLR
jgi:hypothetical protein